MTNESKILIEKYLKASGQDFKYLMSGEQAFGIEFIIDLVKKTLEEKKKIIWIDKFDEGIGVMNYEFHD